MRGAGLVGETPKERAERVAAEAAEAAAEAARVGSTVAEPLPWYLSWLPIRRMSPAEAAAHKATKTAAFRGSVAAAAEGGLPAAAERRRKEGKDGE